MNKSIITMAKIPDLILSQLYLKLFQEKNSLITFIFHGIFRNKEEKTLNLVDPKTWITLDNISQFVKYYLKHDYTFVSPNDIINGLNSNKKYIMITFDDGYYNNKHILPILKKYQIPAVFFPSINHIKNNKCFWWDVLYRENIKIGKSKSDKIHEQNKLKSKKNTEIEEYIKKQFGKKSFKPKSDIDRPFTISELKDFSKEKYVFLGNHTYNHAILKNYNTKEIKSQISDAQYAIYKLTGVNPIIISYPNGSYSDEIIKISKDFGIKLGFTVDYKKNYLPINNRVNSCMCLGRFYLSDNYNIKKQCELFRSDILFYTRIWNLLRT